MAESKPRPNSGLNHYPVTLAILRVLKVASVDLSCRRLVKRLTRSSDNPSFAEFFVISRLGILIALLFLGFRLVRHSIFPLNVVCGLVTWAVVLWLLVDIVCFLLRCHLIDGPAGLPLFDAPRLLLLTLINVVEVVVAFAVLYQVSYYLFDPPPLGGSGLESTSGILLPPDALYFSVISFTTVGYGDIYPVSRFYRMLTASEALLGFVLFVVAIGLTLPLFRFERRVSSDKQLSLEEYEAGLEAFWARYQPIDKQNSAREVRVQACWCLACWILAIGAVITESIIEATEI